MYQTQSVHVPDLAQITCNSAVHVSLKEVLQNAGRSQPTMRHHPVIDTVKRCTCVPHLCARHPRNAAQAVQDISTWSVSQQENGNCAVHKHEQHEQQAGHKSNMKSHVVVNNASLVVAPQC